MEEEKHPGGRPSKLTPQVHETIVQAIRRGNSYENAAKLAGVSYRSFARWMQFGEEDEDGATEFRQFWQDATRANAEYLDEAAQALAKHCDKNYRAPLAVLERRDRANWGRQATVNVQHGGTVEHQHQHNHRLPPLDPIAYLAQIQQMLVEPAADDVVEGEAVEVEG